MTPFVRFALGCALVLLARRDAGLLAAEARADEPAAKVVLLGDSIRLSYAATVAEQLEGEAVVVSPAANGGDSANVLKHLDEWVVRERPDVVHFNCGIHDTKKFKADGRFQVSPEQYEANLRKIVEGIRAKTDAVVLFAATTPIRDDRAARARAGRDYELLNASVERYNAIAARVMRELAVPVDDLNAALAQEKAGDADAKLIGGDGVHLTPRGGALLGRAVAKFVRAHLPAQK
jgi:lysophospholipase L1-like esterase